MTRYQKLQENGRAPQRKLTSGEVLLGWRPFEPLAMFITHSEAGPRWIDEMPSKIVIQGQR